MDRIFCWYFSGTFSLQTYLRNSYSCQSTPIWFYNIFLSRSPICYTEKAYEHRKQDAGQPAARSYHLSL